MQSGEWILAKVAQLLELWNPHPHWQNVNSIRLRPHVTTCLLPSDAVKRWSRFDELQTDINAFPEKFTPFRHSEFWAQWLSFISHPSNPWLGKQLNHILQSKFGGKLQPVKYFPSFIHEKRRVPNFRRQMAKSAREKWRGFNADWIFWAVTLFFSWEMVITGWKAQKFIKFTCKCRASFSWYDNTWKRCSYNTVSQLEKEQNYPRIPLLMRLDSKAVKSYSPHPWAETSLENPFHSHSQEKKT